MTIDQLNNLLDELSKRHRAKDLIMLEAVEKRLNSSTQVYMEELDESLRYLANRKPVNIMKRLNK